MAEKKTRKPPAKTKPNVSTAPNKGGRPTKLNPTDKTLGDCEALGRLQCTTKEMGGFFRVTEKTLIEFFKRCPEAQAAYNIGAATGLISLRRSNFRLAERNAAVAIFLSKNHLGMTDRQDHSHHGPDGGSIPIEHKIDLSKLTDQQLADLKRGVAVAAGIVSDDADRGRGNAAGDGEG